MIQTAIRHDRVTYTSNREELTPGYDLLCFFGSLFYISQDDVASYVGMVGERGSIICCDFEILYEPVLDALDTHVERSSYDHTKNLEGYDSLGVRHIASGTPLVHFTCETRDLAHLLLTEPSIKKELLKRYSPETIYDLLLSDLKNIQSETHVTLKAKLYFSRYQTANG